MIDYSCSLQINVATKKKKDIKAFVGVSRITITMDPCLRSLNMKLETQMPVL